MKRILLSLALLCAVFTGRSQVVLNEVYTDPGDNRSEFFELYNTSVDPNPINLDCYSLVVMYATGSGSNLNNLTRGFYVIDFPNVSIAPKGYLVGAARTPFNVQGTPNVVANFSWSSLSSTSGGSIRKFELRSGSLVPVPISTADMNNLFVGMPQAIGTNFAMFLFDNGRYVNGFMGGIGTGVVPATITGLPAVNVATSCNSMAGSLNIDWTRLAVAEFVNSNTGSDNGYIRTFDGNCGSWDKSSAQVAHTPGTTNGSATSSTSIGTLTTMQRIVCNSKIDFQISANTGAATVFPVEVQLYEDNGIAGALDVADIFIKNYETPITSTSNSIYSFEGIDPTKRYLLVYKTALGCLDKVAAPTVAAGSYTTTETKVCSNWVDFSIQGALGDATIYTGQVNVQLYSDEGTTPGRFDLGDVAIGELKTVSIPAAANRLIIPDEYKNRPIIIVYQSVNFSCFINKSLAPPDATLTLTTTQSTVCGKNVTVSVTAATGTLMNLLNAFPIDVLVYEDRGRLNEFDEGVDILINISPLSIPSTSTTLYTRDIPEAHHGKPILVVYRPATTCLQVARPATTPAGALNTTQFIRCNTMVDFRITGGTGILATPSNTFPITVRLYAENNNNNEFNANNDVLVDAGQFIINSFNEPTQTFNVPVADQGKRLYVVYTPAFANCVERGFVPDVLSASLNTTQSINCNKVVDVRVTGASNNLANAPNFFPVTVRLYADNNINGTLEATDNLIDVPALSFNNFISTSATPLRFNIPVADQGKQLLVVYTTAAGSCYQKVDRPSVSNTSPALTVNGIFRTALRVEYFIVGAPSSNAAAFPVTLQLINDVNRDGLVNAGDEILQEELVNTINDVNKTSFYEFTESVERRLLVRAVSNVSCGNGIFPVSNTQSLLPVTYKSFSAVRKGQNVQLKWETGSEQNNKGFYVQRNTGNEWKDVGFVFSAADRGNSSLSLSYSFNDVNNHSGVSQYRLLQVDIDGKSKYSEVRSVRGEEGGGKLLVYPNPSNTGTLNILFENANRVQDVLISDVSGRSVKQYNNVSGSLEVRGLTNGFYTLRVTDRASGTVTVQKVIVNQQ